MANIKQQIKRNLTNEKRRILNASYKSSVRTAIKRVETAVKENNLEEAKLALNAVNSKLDKGQAKGVFHKNFVSRNKANLAALVNTLS